MIRTHTLLQLQTTLGSRVKSVRRVGIPSGLLGFALLLGGCSKESTPPSKTKSTPAAPPQTSASPRPGSGTGSSALKPIDQAALKKMVETTAQKLLVPGAVVLLRTPQGEFTIAYGTTRLGAAIPPRADTHFRIASNTKTMTAAVILQLAQEGKLGLDDPVSKYVPGVPNGDNITIAELLEMRSGLYNYTNAPAISASVDRDPTRVWTPDELLAIAFAHPPNFPPGTAFEYCNTNYALLGLVVERVDGKPLARAMQDRLFGPLGLQHTVLPASYREHDPRTVLARLPVRQLLGRPGGDAAVHARAQSGGPGGDPPAQRLHGPQPFLCHGGRRRYLHRGRSRHLDPGAGSRPRARRCLSAPLARQPAARGSRASPTANSTGTASADCAGDRTPSISTAARPLATTRSWATIPSTR